MKQQNQVKLLIITCFLILGGLISIQYYLIRNTYQLTSETYVNDVKKEIAPVVEAPELDSLEDHFMERVKKLCLQQSQDSISMAEFKRSIYYTADSIRRLSDNFLQSQVSDYPILNEIKLRIQLTQIIFDSNGVYDTLLKIKDKPIVFIGKSFENKAFNINIGTSHSSVDLENDSIKNGIKYFYKHTQTADIDISNFQQKVWGKMMWMLIAAVGLILAVIFLFFWMYRSLIKQKKIAEIKTDFANNITHELKTPMASLALIIKSLKNEEINQDAEKRMELIQALERQNKRIQNITDRVLESSMNYQNELKKENIVQFLKETSSDFNSETHSFKTDINPEEFYAKTDLSQLERVIQNVLENAQKYSPKNSEILLKSYENNSEYIIEIHDQGKGIPANEQTKIFDKFHRVSEGNQHNIKGLGLGLYLSKQIMKSLGGTISVKSKLGEGSTFILKIPVV
ncbi:sensor histidine kinase [Moheibacter sediminis]|uniref:histidine kinase n=1 Tax=Moheibacter sediminis TaxID=1434700 RepID=A0A1W2C088_9FLAO|nr:HAMP domain-containing sensor histidine kinase [Moheibacter sediminis]SMC78511.1 His Kinase A (phospho-acceptor) domain-containing protein [Moheibacter sediminis]